MTLAQLQVHKRAEIRIGAGRLEREPLLEETRLSPSFQPSGTAMR